MTNQTRIMEGSKVRVKDVNAIGIVREIDTQYTLLGEPVDLFHVRISEPKKLQGTVLSRPIEGLEIVND